MDDQESINEHAIEPKNTTAKQSETLNAMQTRVLGVLMEKELATPEAYPLTLNSTVTACNQKTNREPVTQYSSGEVGHCLRELEQLGYVSSDFGARSERFEQTLKRTAGLRKASQAVLAIMMLRGPQTSKELLSRTERYTDLQSAEEVIDVLNRLAAMDPALCKNLGHSPGQREERWGHLLNGEPTLADCAAPSTTSRGGTQDQRLIALEQRIDTLERQMQSLQNQSAK